MLWDGVEYFERRTKLDLENVDDIVLCQQKKRFTVNLLKERKREKKNNTLLYCDVVFEANPEGKSRG